MEHATYVHLAHSQGWKEVLIMLIGRVWDMWRALGEDPQDRLRTFWSSYFVDQWAIWSVGDNMDIPCTLPSNQCIEAFFRNCSRVIGGRTRMRVCC